MESCRRPTVAVESGPDETLWIRFAGHPRSFRLFQRGCVNPDCSCRETTLHFEEVDPDGEPLAFGVGYDVDRASVTGSFAGPDAARPLLDELRAGVPEEITDSVRSEFDAAREHHRRASSFRVPAETIRGGGTISYPQVFAPAGSMMLEGGAASFAFDEGGDRWYVEDFHCVNPSCRCRTVRLEFVGGAKGAEEADRMFHADVRLDGRLADLDSDGLPPARCREVLEALRAARPDLGPILAAHRRELREIGRRIVAEDERRAERLRPARRSEPVPRPGRAGRNDPCPCGSGRKHKRCCGARARDAGR